MEIKRDLVELVEREVKKEFNLDEYVTQEFKINTKSVTVKVKGENTQVAVTVTLDKAIGYLHEEKVREGIISELTVPLEEFITLYLEEIPVEDMEKEILDRQREAEELFS